MRLSWAAGRDGVGLRGYVLVRNGRRYGDLVRRTSTSVPRPKAAGVWIVLAIDAAGNLGPPSAPVRVR